MKTLKKIVLAVLVSCMLFVPFASSVSAADLIDPDNINAITKYFGVDLSDPASIQKFIDQIKNGGASALLNILGIDISKILAELEAYLGAMEIPTTLPPETTTAETTTAPETTTAVPTTVPTTVAPTYTYPSYNYTPQPVVTTQPETTTFQFIPPEQIYTEAFTTTIFNPVVEDDPYSGVENPIQTAIGVLLLLGSGIGVVIVVLALKRNRI